MMQVVVCFKILPNLDRVLDEDWESFSQSPDLGYAGLDFNCFDRSALEIGLKIKEQAAVQGVETSCTALTVCESVPETLLSGLYAVGYDRVVCLPRKQREFRPLDTADLLAGAIRELGADLVITGGTASMAETGMVPYLLAQKLDFPILTEVEGAGWQENLLCAQCRQSQGLVEKKITLPALCAVGNSPEVLRCATLRAQMKCRGKKPELLKGPEEAAVLTPQLERPSTRRTCTMLDAKSEDGVQTILTTLRAAVQEDGGERNGQTEQEPWKDLLERMALRVYPEDENGQGYEVLAETCRKDVPALVLLPDDRRGRILAAKWAENSTYSCFFGGEIVDLTKQEVTVRKRACAANLLWTEKLSLPAVLTLPEALLDSWTLKGLSLPARVEKPEWLKEEKLLIPAERGTLQSSELVIACGSGMGSKGACDRARELAEKLGAGFGLTRPAALNLWGKPTEIIGQSGSILAPKCVLVLGAAGAGAFAVGIEKAGKIIAVNTDPDALIFKNADLGLQMDAKVLVEKLMELLDIEGEKA